MDSNSDCNKASSMHSAAGMTKRSTLTTPRADNVTINQGFEDRPLILAHAQPFIDFVLRSLLPPAIYKKVHVTLKMSDEDTSDWAAAVPIDMHKVKPSLFDIEVYRSAAGLEDIGLLLVISHELVHIKQFATGQLRGYVTTRATMMWRWNNKLVREPNYWLQPWEVEAHGLERTMLHHYCASAGLSDPFDSLHNLIGAYRPGVDPCASAKDDLSLSSRLMEDLVDASQPTNPQ